MICGVWTSFTFHGFNPLIACDPLPNYPSNNKAVNIVNRVKQYDVHVVCQNIQELQTRYLVLPLQLVQEFQNCSRYIVLDHSR